MKIGLNILTTQKPSFGSYLGWAEVSKNLPGTFSSKDDPQLKKTYMTIDGVKVKSGDTFYHLDCSGKLEENILVGIKDTVTSLDENGHDTIEILYKKLNDVNIHTFSTYYDSLIQVFTKEGLNKLGQEITKIIK